MDLATANAFATSAIAALVALITCMQWVTNRARLRHELFDRRYQIYERISGFVARVIQDGSVENYAIEEFLRQTKQAYFAFGSDIDIRKLVEDIYQHAALLHALQAKVNGLSGQELNDNVDRQTQVKQWFQDTLNRLEHKFAKYLRLQH